MVHIIVLIDSVLKSGRSYYPGTFIGEYKYKLKKESMKRYITEDLTDCDSESEVESNYEIEFFFDNFNIFHPNNFSYSWMFGSNNQFKYFFSIYIRWLSKICRCTAVRKNWWE